MTSSKLLPGIILISLSLLTIGGSASAEPVTAEAALARAAAAGEAAPDNLDPAAFSPGFIQTAQASFAALEAPDDLSCMFAIDPLCATTLATYNNCSLLAGLQTVCVQSFIDTTSLPGASYCPGYTPGNWCLRITTASEGRGLLDLQLKDEHRSAHTFANCQIIAGITANNGPSCSACGVPILYAVCGVSPQSPVAEHTPGTACVSLNVKIISGLWGQKVAPTLRSGPDC